MIPGEKPPKSIPTRVEVLLLGRKSDTWRKMIPWEKKAPQNVPTRVQVLLLSSQGWNILRSWMLRRHIILICERVPHTYFTVFQKISPTAFKYIFFFGKAEVCCQFEKRNSHVHSKYLHAPLPWPEHGTSRKLNRDTMSGSEEILVCPFVGLVCFCSAKRLMAGSSDSPIPFFTAFTFFPLFPASRFRRGKQMQRYQNVFN